VEENLLIGGHARRPGRWDVGRVLDVFPLVRPLLRRPADVLSGGERQAVAIGRGLMANPRLLLFDEVSLGLAPIVVRQLYAALPAIVDGGTTVLIVEQDIGQALRAADRAYCLLEGRVALHGPSQELTRQQLTDAYFGMRTA
jgi:branched-chain amino acid transport system ATP-binding protein